MWVAALEAFPVYVHGLGGENPQGDRVEERTCGIQHRTEPVASFHRPEPPARPAIDDRPQ
jgi:hypothetical protein